MDIISSKNLEKILTINTTLLSDLKLGISIKLSFTPDTIGVDLSFPSYFDFTRHSYVMSFKLNYVEDKRSIDECIEILNEQIETVLDILDKKYNSLYRISQHFQII